MSSLVGLLDSKIALLPIWAVLVLYIGVLLLIVIVATWKKWLTLSGNIAAFILGLFVLYLGGFSAFIILMFFFLGGSLMGKLAKSLNLLRKERR